MPNHYISGAQSTKEKMFKNQDNFWHISWEIGVKRKKIHLIHLNHYISGAQSTKEKMLKNQDNFWQILWEIGAKRKKIHISHLYFDHRLNVS